MGLLALEAGAGRVTALDSAPVVALAAESLRCAVGADRVHAVRSMSAAFAPGERFDVVVCDHVGYFGIDYGIIELLQDARRRFLKQGGAIVPAWIDLHLAPVHAPKQRRLVDGFVAADAPRGLRELHRYAVNAKHPATLEAGAVLGNAALLGRIDLRVDNPDAFAWKVEMQVTRAGRLDGLAGWFDCGLTETVRMTNSPLDPDRIERPQAFLPISEPFEVETGETIAAEIVARPSEDLIAWTVHHSRTGRRFRHSTFDGMIVTEADIRRMQPCHAPRPTAMSRARSIVLGYCDGTRTRGEIRSAVLAEHPDLFPTPEAVSRFVADVLDRDTG